MIGTLGALLDTGLKIIDKVIPDPQAKAAAQLKLMEMQQSGQFKEMEVDLALAIGQMEINKVEAASPDLFRGGWRPGAGWVCVAGLAYQFLAQPLLEWASGINHWAAPPDLDLEQLLGLLAGLLGLGAYRTVERIKGKV